MKGEPVNDKWLSGKPYYCAVCGAGFGEFMACELPDCALESAEKAQERLAKFRAITRTHEERDDGENGSSRI